MELKARSFVVSFFLHLLLGGLFFLWISNDVPKPLPEPIKIHAASFLVPTVVEKPITSLMPKPIPTVTQASPKVQPIVKNIPLQQRPAIQPSVATPIPVLLPVATIAVQAPPVSAPITPSKEIPKIVTPPAPAPNVEKEFLDAHLGEIRALLLQNLKYPTNARRLKMQGEVHVAFTLNTDGSVENIKVIESSGFDVLDEDAMKLIKKTASTFPKPMKSVRINAPLGYVLR